jgi:glycosyltransferase involved in cell wall biosynthesis
MKLLMITGDRALAQGKKGPFYYMLEEFSKHWERIDIICPTTNQKIHNIFGNVFIHVSNTSLAFQPWFILKEGREIFKEQKFDLFTVHGYPPFYNDLGGLWLYNRIKIPYVLEVMHITGYPKAGDIKEWFYKILTRIFIGFFTRKASAVRIINQNQTTKFLLKSGVNKNKIKYAPAFYIDFEIFKPRVTEKKYDIVFSGRLVKNKGINLLLEAIKNIKTQIPNIKLAVTGSGPLENKIKNYIKMNKLEDNVDFIGWVKNIEELAEVYNQSKIMIMPSFNEGGPRVTLEAMACRVPIITSRVGIMLDIIDDGKNGVFIEWNANDISNKVMSLLGDNELRSKIAENGYRAVQQFERKKVIENYAKTYQSLLYHS